MVEVPHLGCIEADGALFLAVHLHVDLLPVNPINGSQVTIGDAQRAVRGRELECGRPRRNPG
jgi:hypothetical protein